MQSKIYLIRHGITEGNIKRWFYGAADVPLAQEGIEALKKQVAEGIYPEPENADYYTSGLGRTEHTLELIYGEKDHEQIEELREMNFGNYETKTYEELKNDPEFIKWFKDKSGKLRTPGGESTEDFVERVTGGWKLLVGKHRLKELSVRHNGKPAESVVVCHGGVISAILETNFPGVQDHFFGWVPDPGHGYELTMKDGEIVEYTKF